MNEPTTAEPKEQSLWITHVTAIGPYLKISGQLDPKIDLPNQLQSLLHESKAIHNSWTSAEKKKHLSTKLTYLVKIPNRITALGEAELLRARMLKFIETQPPSVLLVEVELIDMGYSKVVECEELLIPPQNNELLAMKPLGAQYIMLGIFADWTPVELENILRLIARQNLSIKIEMEVQGYQFIKMKWKDWDFAEFLISQRKSGSPINRDYQQKNFLRVLAQEGNKSALPNNNNNNNNNNNVINNHQDLKHDTGASSGYKPYINQASKFDDAVTMKRHLQQQQLLQLQQQQQQFIIQQQQLQLQQQYQLLQTHKQTNLIFPTQQPVPRLPRNMATDMRSFMLGINQQNSRIPYTGHGLSLATNENTTPIGPTAFRLQRPLGNSSPTRERYSNDTTKNNLNKTMPSTGYKISKFVVGNTHEVCVSFVDKGPEHFYVQLLTAQKQLTEMMNQIERLQLKSLTDNLTIGMACIARYSEDGQLYRAMVVKPQMNGAQVTYIDYGNSEFVKKRDMYEIPSQFQDECAFALPFALAGLRGLGAIDDSLKRTFKEMVVYKTCKLKVMPQEGLPVVQYCQLYMMGQEKNMLEVLQDIKKSRLAYPKAAHLTNNDVVEIRYIESPCNFYVQNVASIPEFQKLMDEMYIYYNANQVVPQHIALGTPYVCKSDEEWYRVEVIRADDTIIIVRLVDFGYERNVTKNLLSTIDNKFLKLPRQAVQCCLKGFENNELNKNTSTIQFEMLAEESNKDRRNFNVKVFRINSDDLHIVNLCTKELNVMKKLYKLSMPFEQYLTLEKEDFHLNGHGGNNHQTKRKLKDDKTNSTTTSSNAGDSIVSNATPKKQLSDQQKQSPIQLQQQQQQQQQIKAAVAALQKQQLSPKSTPALRLQQYNNNNKNQLKGNDWDKHSSNSSDKQRHSPQHQAHQNRNRQQQQQYQHPQQDLHNISLDSNDRRSDMSSGSNRSRGNNYATRQKDKHQKKEATSPKSPRFQKQQQERSNNAPQGYSQSRRTSLESLKDIELFNAPVAAQSEEYMPLDFSFPKQQLPTPITEEAVICWWVSPHQFFTHRKSRLAAFDTFMGDIQKFYKRKPKKQLQLQTGSNVIARYRKDNLYYRARIVNCNHMLRKYKVLFVDYGNQYLVTADDIWQVERRFAEFPIMAMRCSFKGIVSNYDHLYIVDRIEKYIPNGAPIMCGFKEYVNDTYYVDVKVNKVDLLQQLKSDGIVSEIGDDISLDLLAGQQIRAKITSIKNMLNFKIIIEGCDAPLLCSYDDVRYVKSNPDVVPKFKQYYEGKSCVLNIKDVNDDKVILLRPLQPLFKEDIVTYICNYPRMWRTFKANATNVAQVHRLFVQPCAIEEKRVQLETDMSKYYKQQGTALTTYEADRLCAAQGEDGCWYRARIAKTNKRKSTPTTNNNTVEVYYIDYGYMENLDKKQLKRLEERFYANQSAYVIEVNLPVLTSNQSNSPSSKKQPKNNDGNDTSVAVIAELTKILENQTISVEPLECRRNHLLAELITEHGENLVDLLIKRNLVKSRDVDYTLKQLDKDKSSMFEFIEMVDLTLEDEDDAVATDKRQQQVKSPKKKNANVNKATAAQVEQQVAANKPVELAATIPFENQQPVEPNQQPKAFEAAQFTVEPPTPTTAAPANDVNITPKIEPESQPVSLPATEPAVNATEDLLSKDYSEMELAVLSHCDTPAQFFVHPHDKMERLHKLQENLQILGSSLPPLMNAYNGAYCISLYSVDKQWYRAQILDAELMVLKFIDFGNTDCVTDTTDIKEMSVFPDIDPLCIPCSLALRPNGTADWVDAANAIFNESYTKMLRFVYITQGDYKKPSYIKLYIDGVDVAEKLITDGYAKPLELVDSGENCYISHANSLNDFYIQYEKDSKALELIEIYLSDTEKYPKITEFAKHKIVAALFQDDQMWYRAKLLKTLPAGEGYEVLFIDYGNTAVSQECREISAEVANLPPLSKKCALHLSSDEFFGWTDAAEEKFAEIAAIGETVFTIDLMAPAADHALVHLYIDNANINTELEALCVRRESESSKASDLLNASLGAQSFATSEGCDDSRLYNCIVSHSNGPEDFFVQFKKDNARLEDLSQTLNNSLGMDTVTGEPKIGQLYAAVYDDDKMLYRARLLKINNVDGGTAYEVLFVDYGNTAVAHELRILPHDLEQLRSFAKRCALKNIKELNTQGVTTTVAKLFDAILDECEGEVRLNLENAENMQEPVVVNLYLCNNNESVYDNLLKRLVAQESLIECDRSVVHDFGGIEQCLISHAVSPGEFYVQLRSKLTKMEQITAALCTSAAKAKLSVATEFKPEQLYAAYAEEDDCYYRGRLLAEVHTKGYHTIYLIDYGNCIEVKELRELSADVRDVPPIAMRCRLDDTLILGGGQADTLAEYFTALVDAHFGEFFDIEMKAEQTNDTATVVKLQVNGKDLVEQLNEAIKSGVPPPQAVPTVVEEEPLLVLHACVIVQINSTKSFYIQLFEHTTQIEQITDALLDAETKFDEFNDARVGALCAAKFSDDGVFYRARILKVLAEENKPDAASTTPKCLVHFIDFGNDSESAELRALPAEIATQPHYSKHCALDVEFDASAELATTCFQSYVDNNYEASFQIEFLNQAEENNGDDENVTICRLFNQSTNVAAELDQLLKKA